jgi:PAS domain S-box-containing protein
MKVYRARQNKAQKADEAQEATSDLSESEIAEPRTKQAFDDLTRLAAHLCQVPLASVHLIEACRQWFQSRISAPPIEPPIDFTLDAYALLQADILLVPDTVLDERFETSILITADPPIRFYAGMPLFTSKGEALGVLCVMDYVPRALNLEQVEALRALGHQVVTQLELMRNLLGEERTESETKQIGTKMSRSEQELTDFFEHGAVGLHWVGPEGHILRANQAELALLGYSREEYVGQHIAQFHADPEVIEDILRRLSANETLHNYEARLRCKDGSIKHVLIDSNVFWENGQFIHTRCFTRDISANKQLEEERRKAEEEIRTLNAELEERVAKRTMQLEAANQELEAFSYSVSHDLRAPLRSIDGFSQILLEDYSKQLDTEGQDYLQRTRAAAQHMAQLIDDLLNLSRVTRSDMRRERVDLSALAETITAELQQAHPDQAVACIIASGLIAEGDAHLLRIVLENLFSNAWKFTSRHPRAHLEFGSILQPDGRLAYFMRDDGAGFDMAYADKLFGAFQRLHGTTEFPGTGIGLATVQRIIHRHGGRIWAEAAPEKGATFYFTL